MPLSRSRRWSRTPVARHAASSHRSPARRRRLSVLASALGGVLLLGTAASALAVEHLSGNIRSQDITPLLGTSRPTVAAAADPSAGRPVNILVLGSDSRAGANGFVGGAVNGARSDTAVLLHLSANGTRAVAVSIPRDSMVAVPDCVDAAGRTVAGSVRMFNDAFTTGGAACSVKTVEAITHVRIDHYVLIDFAGFKDVVDRLGSVRICLAQPVVDPRHGIDLPAGVSQVDGATALAYVRERYALGDGSDLGRIGRQQAFLSSVLQQATSVGLLTDPARLYSVLDAATRSLTMDPGLAGLPTLTGFAAELARIGPSRVQFVTVPTAADPADRNRLVWTAQAATLWQAIRFDRPISLSARSGSSGTSPGSSSSGSPSGSGVALHGVQGRSGATNICSS